MLSKNQLKSLQALHRKKERREQGRFLVEGGKVVAEVLTSGSPIVELFATEAFQEQHITLLRKHSDLPITTCTAEQLAQAGTLISNDAAIALVKQQAPTPFEWQPGEWLLALDRINDPGNLGSILRIADWYGIRQIICSPDTAELHNPKTLAASKGSFLRIKVHYLPLAEALSSLPVSAEILGAYLGGESIHTLKAPSQGGIILMGNEAQGIHPDLADRVTRRITIPAFGQAESLNVSIATAIICDNLRRFESSLPVAE